MSGYVFRSMKDALRYVETGELGRLAFKPKDKGSNDEDLEEDNICVCIIMFGFSKFIYLHFSVNSI